MLSDLPPNIASFGGEVDGVLRFIWWVVLPWFILAEALLIYFLIRYRKKDGVRAAWMPASSLKANLWVLIPAAIILVCDLAIEVRSTHAWEEIKMTVPPHDELVRVTGRQFVWTFTYAGEDGILGTGDDFQTVNDMHVPRDRIVRFQLESVDVLHAFWVPVLRLKQDAVPGRSFAGWFEATADGTYEIACAELCGAAHTAMRATMTVEPPEIFDAWAATLAEQQAH